jgi:uncharacterized SAM-binding protein YcdF (DUF218 family)
VRRLWVALALSLALLLTLALCNPPQAETRAPRAQAALVLSGDVDYLRTRCAANLQRAGAVEWLIVTGSSESIGGDNATALQAAAERFGVPAARILAETRSRSTRENLMFVAPLVRARGFTRLVLVTSRSHLRRATAVARRVLPEVEWQPVAVPDTGPPLREARNRIAEWVKLLAYTARGWA